LLFLFMLDRIIKMKTFILEAKKRDVLGKKTKALRKLGLIPAIIYGHKAKNTLLSVDKGTFRDIYHQTGSSALVDLKIDDGETHKVLIHEPQTDPVSGEPIHIDFYQVRMDQKIKTEVPLVFVGESKAVKELEGNFVTPKDSVEIECLPNDLISEIKVDISPLETFEDSIQVKDLRVPDRITILDNPEETVSLVEEPRSEEELAELEEEVAEDVETIEVEGEKKEEEVPEGEETPETETKEGGTEAKKEGEAPESQTEGGSATSQPQKEETK